MHLLMCVGYGDWVGGRPPRTVCRNGGPVSPAVGTGPYPRTFPPFFRPAVDWFAGWARRSILQQACGEQVGFSTSALYGTG